jgi:dienelactone hydrolase
MPGMSNARCTAFLLAGAIFFQLGCACAEEVVTFDSAQYLVGELAQRLARDRGETAKPTPPDTIKGYLSRPRGEGPFPAVVHLHGCGGLTENRRIAAGEQFARWGYVTLVVDSFTTRGIKDACTSDALQPPRHADAIGALIYLSRLPFVDSRRIAVVGYSQGGMAALQVASLQPTMLFIVPAGLTFKAAVAYYPDCSAATNRLALPTLILIGELDDWSWAASCERLTKRWDRNSAPLKLIVFPEAYHSFDSTDIRGTVRYFGHWLRYDVEATRRAAEATHDFLAAQLDN